MPLPTSALCASHCDALETTQENARKHLRQTAPDPLASWPACKCQSPRSELSVSMSAPTVQLRVAACTLFAKGGSTSIPEPQHHPYLRQKCDCAKWISVRHPARIRRNRRRVLCGTAPYPTARIFFPVFLADVRQAGERIQFPVRATLAPSLRQSREFSVPAIARGIAVLVQPRPTASRAAWPARSLLLPPIALMPAPRSREDPSWL